MFGATSMTLIVVGLLAQAHWVRRHAGRFGWTAYVIAFAGSVPWVGLLFIGGFLNPALAKYAPELVHPGVSRQVELYGWALLPFGLCLILFVVGYVALAVPAAVLLGVGDAVFGGALLAHGIEPIVIERIGGVPFAMGFTVLMAKNGTGS
jgi:hypothetical protein